MGNKLGNSNALHIDHRTGNFDEQKSMVALYWELALLGYPFSVGGFASKLKLNSVVK